MDLNTLDKRLRERLMRHREVRPQDLDKAAQDLPDSAGNVRQPPEEELEKLREELVTEGEVREERIVRAVERYQSGSDITAQEPVFPEPENETEL
jgi:hypothetical protein